VETFADLLGRTRATRFVGRAVEQELFRDVVSGDTPSRLLWLHGPGGVGKTSLLEAFERIARDAGRRWFRVDLRSVDPQPDAFLGELSLRGWPQPAASASVVAVDTFEMAGSLDVWLREEWLPALSAESVVVVAGRRAPGDAWLGDEGWRTMIREIRLRNFTPAEAHDYLAVNGIPLQHRKPAAELTHGHPLALSLLTELLIHQPAGELKHLADAPDLVASLVQRLLESIPDEQHLSTLRLCAHAWMTTEDLLRETLEVPDAHAAMQWLRGLSVIDEGPYGLFPHDLARDVIDADFRWRDPAGYATLHRQVQRASVRRARGLTGADQQRAIMHVVYAHRRSSATSSYWDYSQLGAVYADRLRPPDAERLLAMTERHQGGAQAALVEHWLTRQPDGFRVIRAGGPDPVGFAAVIRLDLAEESDRELDPAVDAAWRAVERRRPLRPGDHLTMIRFLVDADRNQAPSRTLNLGPVLTIQLLLADPAIAWDLLTWIDTGQMDPLMEFIDYGKFPEAGYSVGDVTYAIFGRDFRGGHLTEWLAMLADRELGEPVPPSTGRREVLALSFTEFADSVRQGLRDLVRQDRLAVNPLCRSRLVRDLDDDRDPPGRLAELIRRAVADLAEDPRETRLARALDRTYLRPAVTQEAAAEVLGLPFSTYRRHLTRGVERVVEKLWSLEVGAEPATTNAQKVSRKRSGE